MSILIISVLTALGISGLCSLAEAVLLSLSYGDIADINETNSKIGEIWAQLKKNIENPIAVILILNTTAHTIGAAVAGAAFGSLFGNKYIWLFSLLFTFLMLQYTEILPKTLGVRFNRRLARFFARPLFYGIKIMLPFIRLTYFFNRPFEPKKIANTRQHSVVDEINLMAALACQRHLIGFQEEQIIERATKLSSTMAKNVMLPINEAILLSNSMSMLQAIEIAHADAHTRFPVCNGKDRNDIVGYVNFKEIIGHQRLNPRATSFKDITRTIIFVEPDYPASKLLHLFITRHEHIAIVRDKQMKCYGLVTLEDLVEELVGEIEDEFDRLPQYIHYISGDNILMGGGCPITTVSSVLKEHFGVQWPGDGVKTIYKPLIVDPNIKPVIDEPHSQVATDSKTLASWMIAQTGGILGRGDQIIFLDLVFSVRRLRRQLVFDVQIQREISSKSENIPVNTGTETASKTET